jgi:hypothetical protein
VVGDDVPPIVLLLWVLFGAHNLANLLSGILMGRVWERNRFVTPAEPVRYYPMMFATLVMIAVSVFMITTR